MDLSLFPISEPSGIRTEEGKELTEAWATAAAAAVLTVNPRQRVCYSIDSFFRLANSHSGELGGEKERENFDRRCVLYGLRSRRFLSFFSAFLSIAT